MLILLGGCASFFLAKKEETPASLMQEGLKLMDDGRYKSATEIFQKIRDRYPYSKFAIDSELKIADSLFETESYEESYNAYNEFERLHPRNPNIPYVVYQKGMCYFEQVSTIDRDQLSTLRAKEEFDRLIKKYPHSQYDYSARRKIRKCYISMIEHELYVGRFYYKMEKYSAAKCRFKYVINNYPDIGQYHVALEYLNKCNNKLNTGEEPQVSWWHKLIHPFTD